VIRQQRNLVQIEDSRLGCRRVGWTVRC